MKTTFYGKEGSELARNTLPKPKDWAHVSPGEGRTGKKTRAKLTSLKERVWSNLTVIEAFQQKRAGLRQSRIHVRCLEPARILTQTDILTVIYTALDDMKRGDGLDWYVKYDPDQLIFVNLSGIIPTSGNDENKNSIPTGHGAEVQANRKAKK